MDQDTEDISMKGKGNKGKKAKKKKRHKSHETNVDHVPVEADEKDADHGDVFDDDVLAVTRGNKSKTVNAGVPVIGVEVADTKTTGNHTSFNKKADIPNSGHPASGDTVADTFHSGKPACVKKKTDTSESRKTNSGGKAVDTPVSGKPTGGDKVADTPDLGKSTSCDTVADTPDSGVESRRGSDVSLDDYNVKVDEVKSRLRSSKSLVDDGAKSSQQKVVKTGFWDKLRFAMSQPVEDVQVVTECRRMFREEMVRLRREVEEFQELCINQVKTQRQYVDDHKRSCEKEITALVPRNGISRRLSIVSEEGNLNEMESNMEFFQQKQKLLDQEMEILNKEEELAKKHKDLEEYEKEIQEVESLLNQRQAICDRRQKHLLVLDEELHSLRQELEESKEQLENEASATGAEVASNKAKKNCLLTPRLRGQDEWDIVRRNLMDKQHLLELTVQKYRSELASASSNITGKEILIGKLQQQLTETEGMVITSERKIKQLENKLAFTVTESRILEEQLHGVNRKNSLNLSPEDTGRRGSFFHRQTSSDQSGSRSKSPMLRAEQSDDSRHQNGSVSARPNSLSPQGSAVIRRKSMRSNSVAGGDTLSRFALREREQETNGSGACIVM